MKIKLFGVLALVLLGTLVGCNNSVEDRHNLEENYRYDEYTHWKYCDDADCLMKDPYPKYLEGEHDLEKIETKVRHIFGDYDRAYDVYKCKVCDYKDETFTGELTENGIYGTLDNPATVEEMPDSYMSYDDKIDQKMTDFPSSETTLYCYVDVAEGEKLFVKVGRAIENARGDDLPSRGSWKLYDSNKNQVEKPSSYSYFEDKYQYVNYGFWLYAVEIPAGRYYIGVTHDAWSGTACYTLALSNTPFVDSEGIPY